MSTSESLYRFPDALALDAVMAGVPECFTILDQDQLWTFVSDTEKGFNSVGQLSIFLHGNFVYWNLKECFSLENFILGHIACGTYGRVLENEVHIFFNMLNAL
jgi:hypothetical protein